jgi:hypothetical protein
MAADTHTSTTQQFLDIHDITNNYVIMKNGTVSVVISIDAMNFGLLAEEEQDAVMYAYAGLLNSINYPIQIIVNSQTKDVTSYLSLLQDQENKVTNETLRSRIRQYREFVSNLIQDRNVLDKKFYVVVAANPLELGLMTAQSVLPGKTSFDINSVERSVLLEKASNILEPRRDHLIAQFARIGLFSRQLATQEIIQLFYTRYNPEATEGQHIGESTLYTSPLVQASIQGAPMSDVLTSRNLPADPGAQSVETATSSQPAAFQPEAATPTSVPEPSQQPTAPEAGTSVMPTPTEDPAGLQSPTNPPSTPVVEAPTPTPPTAEPVPADAPSPGLPPSMPSPETPAPTQPADYTTLPEPTPQPTMPPLGAVPAPAEHTPAAPDADELQRNLDSTLKQMGVSELPTTPGQPAGSPSIPPTTPPPMGEQSPAGQPTGEQNPATSVLPPIAEV